MISQPAFKTLAFLLTLLLGAGTVLVSAQGAELNGRDAASAPSTDSNTYYRWIDRHGNVQYTDFEPIGTPAQQVQLVTTESVSEGGEPVLEIASGARPSDPFHDQDQQILPIEHIGPCADARQQLAVLHTRLPVYRQAAGVYRTAWRGDAYRGERLYLSAEERSAAIETMRSQVLASCSDPEAFQREADAFQEQLNP